MEEQTHPYVPRDLILQDYVPNSLSPFTIFSTCGFASLFIVSLIWFISGRVAKLAKNDRLLMCWWALSAFIHIVVEGYYFFTPEFYKDKNSFLLAELWKEYSKGDSRYVLWDSATVAIEALAVTILGPASLLAVYAIAAKKSYCYILQFTISLGHFFTTAMCVITAILQGDNFASTQFYYYTYYVLFNSFWIVIPLLIAFRCWKKICASVQAESQKKRR